MEIKIKRLDHVQICIPIGKEDEGRSFYCGILGWKEIEKPDSLKPNGGFWMMAGDIEIHVGTEEFENKSKRHPAFEVANLEDVRNYLDRKNVRIKDNTPIPGVNRFSFFDPWNNRFEFLEKE